MSEQPKPTADQPPSGKDLPDTPGVWIPVAEWEAMQTKLADAHKRLAKVREKLKEIVVTEGCDAGVVLLSDYGPTHYDAELKCQIYDHAYFSPLGDALVELAALAEGEG